MGGVDLTRAGVREHVRLAKWEDGRTPADGEPDEVVQERVWYSLTSVLAGAPEAITDPAWVAELDAKAREQGGDDAQA